MAEVSLLQAKPWWTALSPAWGYYSSSPLPPVAHHGRYMALDEAKSTTWLARFAGSGEANLAADASLWDK